MTRPVRSALSRRIPRDRSPVIGLVVLALVGLALTALDWNEFGLSWTHIRTALGESFIVAAALGLTVDFFYKRAVARDAFEASLGYLLPEELKAELRWIYGQQIICVEHAQTVTVRWLDVEDTPAPRRVRVDYELFRTMRNVSNERVEHPTFASVDEWFRGEPSDVDLVEAVVRGERYVGTSLVTRAVDAELPAGNGDLPPTLAPSQLDLAHPGVERTMDRRIDLGPGEEVTFHYRGHETHYESGAFQDNYGAPTVRPAVTVNTPPDLRAVVSPTAAGPRRPTSASAMCSRPCCSRSNRSSCAGGRPTSTTRGAGRTTSVPAPRAEPIRARRPRPGAPCRRLAPRAGRSRTCRRRADGARAADGTSDTD